MESTFSQNRRCGKEHGQRYYWQTWRSSCVVELSTIIWCREYGHLCLLLSVSCVHRLNFCKLTKRLCAVCLASLHYVRSSVGNVLKGRACRRGSNPLSEKNSYPSSTTFQEDTEFAACVFHDLPQRGADYTYEQLMRQTPCNTQKIKFPDPVRIRAS